MKPPLEVLALLIIVTFIDLINVYGLLNSITCSHPDNTETCFEDSVKSKLVFNELDVVVIRCVIRNRNNLVVTWMKNDGHQIPLTIGTAVFTPNKRITVDYSRTDEWNLVIRHAKTTDSGEYYCQVNKPDGLIEKSFQVIVEKNIPSSSSTSTSDKENNKLKLLSPRKQDSSDKKSILNDGPSHQIESSISRTGNVRIQGKQTVFSREEYVSLTCTAYYRTHQAKMDSNAKVDWYHNGMKQSTEPGKMEISMQWKDSDTVVSVLLIQSANIKHSGEWICLKRPTENGQIETASHKLIVLETDKSSSPESQKLAHSSLSFGLGRSKSSNVLRHTTLIYLIYLSLVVLLQLMNL